MISLSGKQNHPTGASEGSERMTQQEALQTVKGMKIKGNSIAINDRFVVVRIGRNVWRLGEMAGDWLRSGTAEEIVERAYR